MPTAQKLLILATNGVDQGVIGYKMHCLLSVFISHEERLSSAWEA